MAKNDARTGLFGYLTSPTGGLVAAGVLFALSAVSATIAICYGALPHLLMVQAMPTLYAVIQGVIAFVLGAAAIACMLPAIHENELIDAEEPEPDRSAKLYGRYLVGVGYAMLVGAIMCSAVLAALAGLSAARPAQIEHESLLGDEFDANQADEALASDVIARFGGVFGDSPDETAFVIVLLFLSTTVALLGALFYFATSLWRRTTSPEQEAFDRNLFWAGLWHRLATAVIFNIVLFFFLRYYAPENFVILPLAALLVGMFLKSGEKLISGLAERFFAAFDALIPPRIPEPEPVPRVVTLTLPELFEGGVVTSKGETLLEALESLKGVSRIVKDPDNGAIRVEFNVNKTSRHRILHEVRLHGIELA